MSRTTSEIIADAVEMAKLSATDMAKLGAVHQATLSKYVNSKLEPDPHWTHAFVAQLAQLYDKRLDRLIELIEEAAEVWIDTPEMKRMLEMVESKEGAQMKFRPYQPTILKQNQEVRRLERRISRKSVQAEPDKSKSQGSKRRKK